jgi:membrane protein YqaA with SNARE-associated domain
LFDFLQAFFTQKASLWSLLAGSFIAATLLPISSEAMLFAVLKLHPQLLWPAVLVAAAGNTAGGMVTYLMGRYIPHRRQIRFEAHLTRYGAATLLFAWTPLVGDALCLGAGWLRLAWAPCLVFMATGKLARYVVIGLLVV